MFDELVNFVEVELAWKNVAWDEEARKKYNTPFYAVGWFRWRTWRCPESGLDYLKWSQSLMLDESWGIPTDHKDYGQPTRQAQNAKEIEQSIITVSNSSRMLDKDIAEAYKELFKHGKLK